ncbi:MAG: serine/threonine-protein kinase [Sandaracinaceae bacterium]
MPDVPKKIGRYSVERLLGQGAMGSVYLGRDPELDRPVAVKTVRHLDLPEKRLKTFLERFKNEARAAGRLHHPAIVAVYDVGEDEAVGPYLVFEYIPGSSLKQILRGRGPLAPDAAVKLGRQIAAALDTAHAADVIHRDVKPDNILVSSQGDAKLADFGVARVPDAALTKEGQFLGTPCYAAPETLNEGVYGPRTDLFSFAAVMYEAISAVRAFPGDDAISVAHRVVHDTPEPPGVVAPSVRIPKEVDRVIMRGLEKDPAARYRSAMELVDALAGAYVKTGVLDRDPTGAQILEVPGPARASKGSGWLFAAIAVGLLGLGLAMVFAFVDLGGNVDDWDGAVPLAPDAGPAVRDVGDVEPATRDAGSADGGFDAGPGTDPDAGPGAIPGMPNVSGMSTFDRQEAAKDEVDNALTALDRGDLAAARTAIARARTFDDGNSDLPVLDARLRELERNQPVP